MSKRESHNYMRAELSDGRCGEVLDESENTVRIKIDPFYQERDGSPEIVSVSPSSILRLFSCKRKDAEHLPIVLSEYSTGGRFSFFGALISLMGQK